VHCAPEAAPLACGMASAAAMDVSMRAPARGVGHDCDRVLHFVDCVSSHSNFSCQSISTLRPSPRLLSRRRCNEHGATNVDVVVYQLLPNEKMVEIIPVGTGTFRNRVLEPIEDLVKQFQLAAWDNPL
jgi:hypothetical protein